MATLAKQFSADDGDESRRYLVAARVSYGFGTLRRLGLRT